MATDRTQTTRGLWPLVNEKHSHAEDDRDPAIVGTYRGEHVHEFREADDHWHEAADGSDTGVSPHDFHSPGDKCSPCGYGMTVRRGTK